MIIRRKSIINRIISVIGNILWIGLGIFGCVAPSSFASSLGIVAGSFMIAVGALMIIYALFSKSMLLGSGTFALEGLVSLSLGLFLVILREESMSIVTFTLAFYFLFNGITKAVASIDLRKFKTTTWWITGLIGILYIVLAIVLFIFNNEANNVVSILIGIFFIISGVFGLLELFDSIKREKRETKIIKNLNKHVDNLDHIDIDFTK